uniref:Uncharacterized protein n=1 Tax=Oryzias latipes TaxID=8090 RepID=A0A3P9JN83_ORYLA
MFTCRAAWQRSGSAARRAAFTLRRDGGFTGPYIPVLPIPQAYSTVSSDHNRFNSRLEELKSRPKTEWVAKPWPPKSKPGSEFGR